MNRETGLSSLLPGETGLVQGLWANGPMRRRLQDVGLIPGTRVECVGRSPLGDPRAYLIRGTVIALRDRDAQSVRIRPASVAAEGGLGTEGRP